MDAIILAGGLGTRLKPVVSEVPKPLAPIGDRPFLDLLLQQLDSFEQIEKVILAISYKAELIQQHYQGNDKYHFEIDFSIEDVPLGTGGAIKHALPFTTSNEVLILNGDSFVEFDLTDLHQTHIENKANLTLVAVKVNDTERYGSVDIDMSTMRIAQFSEKQKTNGVGFINAGCYLLKKCLFNDITEGQKVSFEKQILPSLVEKKAYAQISTGKFIDIGTPKTYQQANSGYFN
ncbi:MAG: D-glycero-D-manno-heptose 1-phosphate guanosyltransferase [Candidatus Parabeggiatoa sp. nov. 1]|nr:MAG: D-glycero-D-manno-heptose 1-phosphate guanosyltransferase [Gammaproteobacteria bacterium]